MEGILPHLLLLSMVAAERAGHVGVKGEGRCLLWSMVNMLLLKCEGSIWICDLQNS